MLSSLQDTGRQQLPPGALSVSWQRGREKVGSQALVPPQFIVREGHTVPASSRGQRSTAPLCVGRKRTWKARGKDVSLRICSLTVSLWIQLFGFLAFEHLQILSWAAGERSPSALAPAGARSSSPNVPKMIWLNEENLIPSPGPLNDTFPLFTSWPWNGRRHKPRGCFWWQRINVCEGLVVHQKHDLGN